MAVSNEPVAHMVTAAGLRAAAAGNGCLKKFKLYETVSKYYLVGTDKDRTKWRVLEVEKSEHSELNIHEDPMIYSKGTWKDFRSHLQEENRRSGGLKYVAKCYGIIGFIKFMGPYYMWLVTKRKKTGSVCGHTVYSISKSEMFALTNSVLRSMTHFKDENRYKKLLRTIDLTKECIFSYSYNLMHSLQSNICQYTKGKDAYKSMFVWNDFLTCTIRKQLCNTAWTVALIHGCFKQANYSVARKEFKLILIARRSRYFAGTRFLKRGVDDDGNVANEVETEQIVYEVTSNDSPSDVTSIVQHRGSIPLYWSQQTSGLNIKPEILLDRTDKNYETTRLHFENLLERYGHPIIILSLVKSMEKKPQESLLNEELSKSINYLNNQLPEDKRLTFSHWDLKDHYLRERKKVLESLGQEVTKFLKRIGIFYYQLTPAFGIVDDLRQTNFLQHTHEASVYKTESGLSKSFKLQKGVLRSNCIDCLDRTNVAQYAYGLAALSHQLQALKFLDAQKIDLHSSLAKDLMILYERTGDELAFQYGGSASDNKIFSEIRGQWKAAIQAQDLTRKMQRFYNNTYMDAEKQDVINLFLGYFQPKQGEPALWNLDKSLRHSIQRSEKRFAEERSFMQQSSSEETNLSQSKNGDIVTNENLSYVHSSSLIIQQEADIDNSSNMILEVPNSELGKLTSRYFNQLPSSDSNDPCESKSPIIGSDVKKNASSSDDLIKEILSSLSQDIFIQEEPDGEVNSDLILASLTSKDDELSFRLTPARSSQVDTLNTSNSLNPMLLPSLVSYESNERHLLDSSSMLNLSNENMTDDVPGKTVVTTLTELPSDQQRNISEDELSVTAKKLDLMKSHDDACVFDRLWRDLMLMISKNWIVRSLDCLPINFGWPETK